MEVRIGDRLVDETFMMSADNGKMVVPLYLGIAHGKARLLPCTVYLNEMSSSAVDSTPLDFTQSQVVDSD